MYAHPTLFIGKDTKLTLIILFFNSFVMPAVSFVLMKALGFIKTFEMEDPQERIIPFISAMIFYIWTFMIVKNKMDVPPMMVVFFLGILASLMMSFVINLFHKLSIHMVGVSGLLASMLMMLQTAEINMVPWILGGVMACGLVATARLYLKAHTPRQIYTGFLIGISGQMLGVLIFKWFMA
jgi:hypothetical protein